MSGYFNRFDVYGTPHPTLIPDLSLKELLTVSVMRARSEDERLKLQADFVLTQEEEHEKARQAELEKALEVLRELLQDGEQGLDPSKALATARFAQEYGRRK